MEKINVEEDFEVNVWQPLIEDEIKKLKKQLKTFRHVKWNEYIHGLYDKGEIDNAEHNEYVR